MLFGDDHSNMENLCSDPCTHLDLEGNVVHHEGCYDIISSLSMIFENNEGTENMIDFYLETPYAYKNSYPENIKKVCVYLYVVYSFIHVLLQIILSPKKPLITGSGT